MKAAKFFVSNAAAKKMPENTDSLIEPFRIARIPTYRQRRLRKRHWASMRKVLESASSHGVSAKRTAASSAVGFPYSFLPIL